MGDMNRADAVQAVLDSQKTGKSKLGEDVGLTNNVSKINTKSDLYRRGKGVGKPLNSAEEIAVIQVGLDMGILSEDDLSEEVLDSLGRMGDEDAKEKAAVE